MFQILSWHFCDNVHLKNSSGMHSLFHRLFFSMQWRDVLHFPVLFDVGLCARVCARVCVCRTPKADHRVFCSWLFCCPVRRESQFKKISFTPEEHINITVLGLTDWRLWMGGWCLSCQVCASAVASFTLTV